MAFTPTPAQARAIVVPVGTVVVSAGAGTGKTSVLSETVVRKMIAGERIDVRELLVLTFTNKAAVEMAERITRTLSRMARESDDQEIRDFLLVMAGRVPDAPIETIDAFSQRLLREFPGEAGIDPSFEIMSPDETARLGIDVAEMCFGRWLDNPPHERWPDLVRECASGDWATLFVQLEGHLLTREAMTCGSIVAGLSGSETEDFEELFRLSEELIAERLRIVKDDLISNAIELESLLPQVIAEGSNGKEKAYAGHARNALASIPGFLSWLESDSLDFDALVIQEIASWKLLGVTKGFAGEVNEIVRKVRDLVKGKGSKPGIFESFKVDLKLIEHRIALACALRGFHEEFRAVRFSQNRLTFADCEIEALKLLRDYPDLKKIVNNRYRYVVVDEYQDINPLQQELIFRLARPATDGGKYPSNLYVVGDERQSIYGFRDADFTLIRDLRIGLEESGDENSGSRVLHENFRSRPEILNFSNHIFRNLWGDDSSSDVNHTDLVARHAAYTSDGNGKATIEFHLTETDNASNGRRREARVIANRIHEIVSGQELTVFDESTGKERPIEYGDCAILIRKTRPFSLYETELGKLGIPSVTESGGGFWETGEVGDIRALLACLSNLSCDLDRAVLLRSPWVGLSDDALLEIANHGKGVWQDTLDEIGFESETDRTRLKHFMDWFERAEAMVGHVPVDRMIEFALKESGYSTRVYALDDGGQVWANIEKLIDFVRSEGPYFDPGETARYIDWLRSHESREAQAVIPSAGGTGAITLATVHQAKGREWPLVVVADLNAGTGNKTGDVLWSRQDGISFRWLDPETGNSVNPSGHIVNAETRKQLEASESMRVMYVALTRAREHLVLSSSLVSTTSKEGASSWKIGNGSWLSVINDSYTGLVIDADDDSQSVDLEFEMRDAYDPDSGSEWGMTSIGIKSYVHREVPEHRKIDRVSSDDELSKCLAGKIETLPDLPAESYERYLVTATELAVFQKCPRMYAYRSLWHVPAMVRAPLDYETDLESGAVDPERSTETLEFPSSELGTIAHKILEIIDLSNPPDRTGIDELVRNVLSENAIENPGLAGKLARMTESALGLPIMKTVAGFDDVRMEFRLTGGIGRLGQTVLGTIDLLAIGDDRVVLIDYKSGEVRNPSTEAFGIRAERYKTQMAVYSHLVGNYLKVSQDMIESHIVYLNPAHDEILTIDPDTLDASSELADTLVSMSRERNLAATPSADTCRWCDYGDICGFSLSKE